MGQLTGPTLVSFSPETGMQRHSWQVPPTRLGSPASRLPVTAGERVSTEQHCVPTAMLEVVKHLKYGPLFWLGLTRNFMENSFPA